MIIRCIQTIYLHIHQSSEKDKETEEEAEEEECPSCDNINVILFMRDKHTTI